MKLRSILTLSCPVCGQGRLFNSLLDTPEQCPRCRYFFMRETGYYLPHYAIAYPPTVAVALLVWPILQYVFGVQSNAIILSAMILAGIVFGFWFIRYAKMIWLVIDLTIHK